MSESLFAIVAVTKCRCGNIGNDVTVLAQGLAEVKCEVCKRKWHVINATKTEEGKFDAAVWQH